jgi:putative N6-adenine-specific DNA methylase
MNIAPGIFRENFSFIHSKLFNSNVWRMLRNEALSKASRRPPGQIIASDINPMALKAARENAKSAGISKAIDFSLCDFRETQIPKEKGVIFLNPEYGARLGEVNRLKEVYVEIGDFFKKKCSGYTGYVFTGNMDLAKSVGLATTKKMEFYNAKIDCRLLEYELYEGSRNENDK